MDINLNQRERLAVQLKKLPEADRWRIFMMQQHMLVSHIETLEHIFDTQIAAYVRRPGVALHYGGWYIGDFDPDQKYFTIVLQFRDAEHWLNALDWLHDMMNVIIPSAPSLRISVKTHKIEDLGHKVGK